MHAVSQAAEPLKAPCIYAQLDGNTADAAAAEDEDDDDIDEAGHSGPNDIRLIPSDEAHGVSRDSLQLPAIKYPSYGLKVIQCSAGHLQCHVRMCCHESRF